MLVNFAGILSIQVYHVTHLQISTARVPIIGTDPRWVWLRMGLEYKRRKRRLLRRFRSITQNYKAKKCATV